MIINLEDDVLRIIFKITHNNFFSSYSQVANHNVTLQMRHTFLSLTSEIHAKISFYGEIKTRSFV